MRRKLRSEFRDITPVKKVSKGILNQLKNPQKIQEAYLFELWETLADPEVKRKAVPHRLYGKRLYVRVNDSMWAHELTLTYRSKILALLQDRVGKENLEDVHFAVKQW